jgi:hypothetical protein
MLKQLRHENIVAYHGLLAPKSKDTGAKGPNGAPLGGQQRLQQYMLLLEWCAGGSLSGAVLTVGPYQVT